MSERWTPCEYPERRLDLDVGFHTVRRDVLEREGGCHGCVVAVEAATARSGSVADDICFGRRATPGDAATVIEAYEASLSD